ncbi:AAA family ATPase [Streptomyces sp. NPDC060006]|uniref:helix-turn-helix transcriptional regulator n=1 Tax=unclassified Streptomyces TaxID=2593676 RepID=UPI00368A7542
MSLIGRSSEMAACCAALSTGAHSAGVVIRGAAGIGKTELWRAVTHRDWGADTCVLSTTGRGETVSVPLAGMADLLDPVVHGVLHKLPYVQADALRGAIRAAPAASPADEGLLVRACVNALRALSAPRLLIAIDDEHWLDEDSRRLLSLSASLLSREPIGWLIAVRTGNAQTGLAKNISHDLAPRISQINLTLLDEDLLGSLVLERFPDPRWSPILLRQVTQYGSGNPYLTLEIARETIARSNDGPLFVHVPTTLAEVLLKRLRQLRGPVLSAVQIASLSAHPTRQLLRRILGPEADGYVDDAVDADVLRVSPPRPGVSFSHPLLREAAHQTMSQSVQRRWHQACAAATTDPDVAAGHLAAAARDPDEHLASVVFDSAQRSLAVGAPVRSLVLAEAAVALTPDRVGDTAWRRRLLQVECLVAASEFDRARTLCEDWSIRDDIPVMMRGELLAWRAWLAADVDVGIRYLEEAIPLLEYDVARAAMAATELARRVGVLGLRPVEAKRISQLAVQHARKAADPIILRGALGIDGFLAALTGDPDAGDFLGAAVALPGLGNTPFPYHSPETRLSMWHMWRGELSEARRWAQQVLEAGNDRGRQESVWGTRLQLVEIEWRAGRWDTAAEHAARIDEFARVSGFGQKGAAAFVSSLLAAGRGETDEARRIADTGVREAEKQGDAIFAAQCRLVLGQLELSIDDPAAAAHWLRPLLGLIHDRGLAEPGIIGFLPDLVEAEVRLGHLDTAATYLRWLRSAAADLNHAWARIAGRRSQAALYLAQRKVLAAVQAAADSAAEAGALCLPFEQARSLLLLGTAQRRARQRRAAAHTLDAAHTAFIDLGAVRWATLATAQRSRLMHASTTVLTPSEERVAELAGMGRTNREIADSLLMSVKTVEANLTRVYRKLGVRNRSELTALRRD